MRAVTLTQFAGILAKSIAVEAEASMGARAVVSAEIAERTRARFGNAEKLPPPLADSTQAERVRAGYASDETLLREGELRDSYSWHEASPLSTQIGSTSPLAPFHELGTLRIPARAPLFKTLTEDHAELEGVFAAAFVARFRLP